MWQWSKEMFGEHTINLQKRKHDFPWQLIRDHHLIFQDRS